MPMVLKLIKKHKETDSVTSFIFEPEKKIKWAAGQYIVYRLPHENQDLRGKTRFFTISSSPFENYPTITTRIEEKPSSFKNALNNLKIGTKIEAKEPDGDFVIKALSKHHIFIAGGIGITPFMSIIRQLDFDKKDVDITLLYANKNKEIVFKKELDAIAQKHKKLKLNYFISPARIDKKVLKEFVNNKNIFYVSGPDPMVEAMLKILDELGVKKENIKDDYFSGYKEI